MPATYATVMEAEEYFLYKINVKKWDRASQEKKFASLVEASRLMSNLQYKGAKADSNQELEFPRNDQTEIPENIKFACCECALALLNGFNLEIEAANMGASSHQFSSARSTYDSGRTPDWIVAGIPSYTAWQYMLPYLAPKRSITLP